MLSRHTAIHCCYLVAFMDLFAVGMFIPLFNRRGRQLGASSSVIGLIGPLYIIFIVFSAFHLTLATALRQRENKLFYAGKASDTWGRKPILLLSYLGCFVGYLSVGASDSILFFALSRFPTGILKHSQTAARALLSDLTRPEEKAGALGMFNAFGTTGFIIGPIIGGTVAMQENGFFKVSLLTCTVYVGAFIFVWLLFDSKVFKKELQGQHGIVDKSSSMSTSEPQDVVNDRRRRLKHVDTVNVEKSKGKGKEKEPTGILSFLKIDSVRNVLDLLLIRFVMGLGMMTYRSNFTGMLDYRYGIDAKNTGYIISFGSIVGTIANMSIGVIYSFIKNDANMMFYGGLLMTVSLFGISLSPNVYVVILCMAPLGASSAIMRVNSHNLMLKHCRADEKGAVMGVGNSSISIGRMLSPAIAGFAQEISVVGPCWLATCFAGIGIGLMAVFPQDKPSTDETKKTD